MFDGCANRIGKEPILTYAAFAKTGRSSAAHAGVRAHQAAFEAARDSLDMNPDYLFQIFLYSLR